MAAARATGQVLLPWLVLGPLCAGAGALVGFLVAGSPAPDAVPAAAPVPGREVGMPSLAPLVDRVRDAVVGVQTIHRLDPELLLAGPAVPAPAPEGTVGGEPVEAAIGAAAVGDGAARSPRVDRVTRGTGFLIHGEGLVLTAHHVVAQPSMIVVEVPGFGRREAVLVGEDPVTDVAVLRIVDPPEGLPTLRLGDSEAVRQGDWVMTLGNPLELQQTASAGVVGFVGRHIAQDAHGVTNEHIQFGAPTYPGSSGSPVFDLRGEIVGMTTRAATQGDGFAFAVTSRVIRNVLASMERHEGRARRAHLGATVEPARGGGRLGEHDLAERFAVELRSVSKGCAAERAGLRPGDVVVALDGAPIRSLGEFYDALTWAEPGADVVFDVVRGGARVEPIRVELGELGVTGKDPSQ